MTGTTPFRQRFKDSSRFGMGIFDFSGSLQPLMERDKTPVLHQGKFIVDFPEL